MTKEEQLKNFYDILYLNLEKNQLNNIICFEEIISAMLLGYELNDDNYRNLSLYQFLLLWNTITNENENLLEPYSLIDYDIYNDIMSDYKNDYFKKFHALFISEFAKSLVDDNDTISKMMLKDRNSEIENTFNVILILKNILVNNQQYCNHFISLLALTEVYHTIFKLNLDKEKIYEMIMINGLVEMFLNEGINENILKKLNKGYYFVKLYKEFQNKSSKEAEFISEIDLVLKSIDLNGFVKFDNLSLKKEMIK